MLLQFAAGNQQSSADKLSSVLEQCRGELDAIRQDLAWNNGGNGRAGDLERRLRRTADRLEHAIGTSVRLDRLISEPAPSRAAAPILAREADHRIKNGLTTVLALLHRQAAAATDPSVGEALRVAGARVSAVAQLHACLSDIALVRGEDREVPLGAYLRALCGAIVSTLDPSGNSPPVNVDVDAVSVTPNSAQSIGLIVSELVTNALRHAVRDHALASIRVTGEQVDGAYLLSVQDDGGLATDVAGATPRAGLDLKLVNMIAEQLRARLIIRAGPGARVTVVLNEPIIG